MATAKAELMIVPDVNQAALHQSISDLNRAMLQHSRDAEMMLQKAHHNGIAKGARDGAKEAERTLSKLSRRAGATMKRGIQYGLAGVGVLAGKAISDAMQSASTVNGYLAQAPEMYLNARRQQSTAEAAGLDVNQYGQQVAMYQRSGYDADTVRGIYEGVRDTMSSDANLFSNYDTSKGAAGVLNDIIANNAAGGKEHLTRQLQKAGVTGEDLSAVLAVASEASGGFTNTNVDEVLKNLTANTAQGNAVSDEISASLSLESAADKLNTFASAQKAALAKDIAGTPISPYVEKLREDLDHIHTQFVNFENNSKTANTLQAKSNELEAKTNDMLNSVVNMTTKPSDNPEEASLHNLLYNTTQAMDKLYTGMTNWFTEDQAGATGAKQVEQVHEQHK